MKEIEIPNYYSVIPAYVRYSQKLSFFDIVLYSEITALANAFGYCFASNSYFSRLYRKDPATISRSISRLVAGGFVRLEIEAEQGNARKIFLTPPIDENVNTPIDENVNHNNTSINTDLKSNARTQAEKDIVVLFERVCSRGSRLKRLSD